MTTLPPRPMSVRPATLPPGPGVFPGLPGDASWMALLADTSVGLGSMARWRVRVSQASRSSDELSALRLVVQSYRRRDIESGRPAAYARPLTSTQRTVYPAELREGVLVDLVSFDEEAEDSVVLAWSEADLGELDYDGLEARPGQITRLASVEAVPTQRTRNDA